MPIEIKDGKIIKVRPNRVRLILEEEDGKILEEHIISSSGECSVRQSYYDYKFIIMMLQKVYSNRFISLLG